MRKERLIRVITRASCSLTGMKMASLRWRACLVACAFLMAGAFGARVYGQQRVVRITRSPLMKLLRERLEKQPRTSDVELADYANTLLAQSGFAYEFDACEFIRLNSQRRSNDNSSPYRFQLAQVDGRKITFQIGGDAVSDGMCGECFFSFPSLRVTKAEIVLLTQGNEYRLKRPRLLGLDEMSLVDNSMKRVLRTWEVPSQSVPLGISEDGTRLYIATELEQLALEVAPSGVSFKATSRIEMQNGKDVEKHPRDSKNAYLGFMRFGSGKKSYIVRYSAPCT